VSKRKQEGGWRMRRGKGGEKGDGKQEGGWRMRRG
jgi:hypothetical protein